MNMQRPRRVSAGRAWGHGGSAPRGTVPEPRGGGGAPGAWVGFSEDAGSGGARGP